MFEDLIKTVKSQLYDRITSPLLGCFLISWFIWNYRFIFTLFSNLKIAEKFKYIDSVIYKGTGDYFIYFLALPLLTTVFFIFIYPYPAKFTYEFFRKRQVELKEIQQRLDNETPLTKEEAKKIRSDAIKMSIDFEQEIEKLREENLSLRKLLKESNESNSNVNNEDMNSRTIKKHSSDIKLDSEHIDYEPFFSKDSNVPGNSRLLLTGPEHIKASIENHISSDKLFNGHSFMVSIDSQNVLISLLFRNGKTKTFKYDYHIPENGKIGYESMRIINSFDEDFLKFTKKNETTLNK
ncbi:hypothetical protein ACY0L0_001735 [Serratia marcescens]|uniref:hypothetical protein n=1 Tax=Serratia TaxID=613 RepID=UPI00044C7886|nr:hypothetical protein [Serratia marcescens]ETX40241.1 hypothetical protein P805_03053 [Serratia marcescens BIDMC 44]